MIPNGHGLPDLSKRTQLVLRKQRLIVPGSAELRDGGLGVDGCVAHLRCIDIINGVAWLVPVDPRMGQLLAEALVELIPTVHAIGHELEEGDV